MAISNKPDYATPMFDYRSYEVKEENVDELVARITKALVELEDKAGIHKYTIADGRVIDSTSWNFWEWQQAIGLYGLFNYYNLKSTENPSSPEAARTLKIIKEWYTARAAEGGTTKNINSMAVLLTLASLMEVEYQRGGIFSAEEKKLYEGWIDEWAEWAFHDCPRTEQGIHQHITFRLENKNQVWDDTLMMTVLPLAKIGKLLNRPHYIEEAKYQFVQHAQYLMDPTNGLWNHGYEFDGKGGGHEWGHIAWARGNCWITIAIPIFLDLIQLPKTDTVYRTLVSVLHRQVDTLVKLQDAETGLWRTLLLDETSYVESSASAGFVAGMFIGIRTGLLEEQKYIKTALTGLRACIAQVKPNGEVQNVSKGTPVSTDPNFYKDMPKMTVGFGQSLPIMALGEWLRYEKAKAKK
ncbi:uncharacterized protein I303_102611 [Kwoniella dejecticola CBS 10117]|uniref:Glycosyl hydrolase family 88 n=1 Tax=Kwoniella dejecticola CBS 10117 TaxID=1296121 RepID=A0A1A6A980_9TREE|nr:uncharacterized protein I303_02625 [Kwoniella dejecticola CBS 10117]OBR86616.1 hypothetical protein I303_02625 [Kwoniella dejecticola CBS 10117]